MLGQDEFLEHIDKCIHPNKELKHHSTSQNSPFCMRYWKCPDCDAILSFEDLSIVSTRCSSKTSEAKI